MTLKGWAVAAVLVWLTACAAHAAPEANFAAGTTGDLVELCAATPDNALGTAAVNFCEGFAQGAVSVESGCGAVTVGQACLLPPLSSGGALVARP